MQLGAGYPMTPRGKSDFKVKFSKALAKVAKVYPELGNHRIETDVFMYVPSKPDIPLTSTKKHSPQRR